MIDFFVIKILILTSLSFVVAILWTPALTHFLYKYKMGKSIRNTGATPVFSKMHAHKQGTPTMGGILIWVTVLAFAVIFYLLDYLFEYQLFDKLNFLTQKETLLPLGALVATAIVGLFDDWLDIRGKGKGGITVWNRLFLYALIAIIGAWWFYAKLGWSVLHVPFLGSFEIGFWYIPFFIFVIVATAFSVNEIDGLDGLAGGTLVSSYAAFGVIAFVLERYDLAVFCGVVIGALMAFLWFNIIPARFIMGDTGAMSLGVTLGIIALLTNNALLLPIIGLPFVIESVSVFIQIGSKKLRNGKKVFRSAPIHHHFEAMGWPEAKIVMRTWVVANICAAIGLALFLLDKTS